MLDFGFTEMLVIAAVALVVVGPEKLPTVAREVGRYVGKAQRYLRELQDEISRSAQLQDLQKMKRELEQSARELEQKIERGTAQIMADWETDTDTLLSASASPPYDSDGTADTAQTFAATDSATDTSYADDAHKPRRLSIANRRNWRAQRGTIPAWYRRQQLHRRSIRSHAARVAGNRHQHNLQGKASKSSKKTLL